MCKKLVLLFSLVLVLGLTLPATAQTNLLLNPDFEDGTWENEQSTPDHWWRLNFDGGWGLDWKQDPAGSHGGTYHKNSYGPDGAEMWWGQDLASMSPGFTYTASAWFQAEWGDDPIITKLRIEFKDENNDLIRADELVITNPLTDWTEYSFTTNPAPAGTTQGNFILCLEGLAAVKYDDCSLTGEAVTIASNQNPPDNAEGIGVHADLTWLPGCYATSHDVYFGTDPTPDADEFQGNQTGTTFDPGVLDSNTTYYWRIDELNSPDKWIGKVWSFTTTNVVTKCQIGAVLGDWAQDATFPGDGEQGIVNYENIIQGKVAAVKLYHQFFEEFPFSKCTAIYNHGTESSPTHPYIDIGPNACYDDTEPRLLEIVNGAFDSDIQKWAQQTKEYGKPLWICFDGEMNGGWHPGSGAANGGGTTDGYGDPTKPDGPEIYVDACRHIHDIFESVGADNVAWVWAVNHADVPEEDWNRFENYYPGDNYVDWLGVDGYNWNREEYGGWKSFHAVFDDALNRLRPINAEKPIIIAEFGCAHKDTAKSEWIIDAFNRLKTNYPYVECFIWFDIDKEENWLIDSDGKEAPRQALSDSYFVSEGNPKSPTLDPDRYINIALNKPATASSVEAPEYAASYAVDGRWNSRWSSKHSDPQWIRVDLGASYDIVRVILDWERAYGKSYKIQVSDNDTDWTDTDVYSTTDGNGDVDNIAFSPAVSARYVRMYGTERGTQYGYSLWELGVYIKFAAPIEFFDTGSPANPYPCIMGSHTGTIKPNHAVIATKMYTYPCSGTGGHTEYVKIWNSTWNATATWNGYIRDWKNITFDKTVVLLANETYNYTVITGSYPQIYHTERLERDDGVIECAQFTDANGKIYPDWILAIRLE